MIFSIVENVGEEKVQKIQVKGDTVELTVEFTNILKMLIKRGFPDELILEAFFEVLKGDDK